MEISVARALARNLIERLLPDNTGKLKVPDGVITAEEANAIRALVNANVEKEAALVPQRPGQPSMSTIVIPEPVVRLNEASLTEKVSPSIDVTLCLDFGTAMSKGWAWSADMNRAYPLVLGQRAGESDDAPLVSSVYVSREGLIYFGRAAEVRHLDSIADGHIRLDNLKRQLSEGFEESDLDAKDLPAMANPSGVPLTYGDAIQLYLAFLTDIALEDLYALEQLRLGGDKASNKVTSTLEDLRYVRRRFAMPSFVGRREKRAKDWLRQSFMRAQILADTFRGRWREGIPAREARATLDACRKLTRLPEYLLDEDDGVKEPIAAIATRVDDEFDRVLGFPTTGSQRQPLRRLIMVVDAGAGTTDFAMFIAACDAETGEAKYRTIAPTVRFSEVAGNRVDEALRLHIFQSHRLDPKSGTISQEDFDLLRGRLNGQLRQIKEQLLRDGQASLSFGAIHDVRVNRDEFLTCDAMRRLSSELEKKRDETLEALGERFFSEMSGQEQGVYVALTGGTSNVPMFQRLAHGERERSKEFASG